MQKLNKIEEDILILLNTNFIAISSEPRNPDSLKPHWILIIEELEYESPLTDEEYEVYLEDCYDYYPFPEISLIKDYLNLMHSGKEFLFLYTDIFNAIDKLEKMGYLSQKGDFGLLYPTQKAKDYYNKLLKEFCPENYMTFDEEIYFEFDYTFENSPEIKTYLTHKSNIFRKAAKALIEKKQKFSYIGQRKDFKSSKLINMKKDISEEMPFSVS